MGELSPWHWAIIAVVVVILFGTKKLPDAARSLGRSLRIFKTELQALHDDENQPTSASTPDVASAPAAPAEAEPGTETRAAPPVA